MRSALLGLLAFCVVSCATFSGDDGDTPPPATTTPPGAPPGPVVSPVDAGKVIVSVEKAITLVGTTPATTRLKVMRVAPAVGSATITVRGLPKGVVAKTKLVAPSDDSTELELVAAEGTRHGDVLGVKVEARVGDAVGIADLQLLIRGAPGVEDNSFGDNGVVDAPGEWDLHVIVADGSFYLGSTTTLQVRRFDVDGKADLKFGTSGVLTAPTGLRAMTATPANLYFVADQPTQDSALFVIERRLTNGALDTKFASGGVFQAIDQLGITSQGIAVSPTGRIAVSGFGTVEGNPGSMLLWSKPMGGLDLTTGPSGRIYSGASEYWKALIWDADRVVGAGAGMVNRVTADGKADTSFNGTGEHEAGPGRQSNIIVDPSGRYVGSGEVGPFYIQAYFFRLTSSGTSDPTVGNGTGSIALGLGRKFALAATAEGKIAASRMGAGHCEVRRLMPDLTFDQSFGVNGEATPAAPACLGVAVQPSGKILIVGPKSVRLWM